MSADSLIRLSRPGLIAFDCYRTLLQNDPADWESMFGEICREQGLPLSGHELWERWKKHEVRFRTTRLDMAHPEKSPPFKSYESAWAECFDRVFEDGVLKGDAAAASRRCVGHMARRPPFPETLKALTGLSGKVRTAVLSNADDAFLRPALARLPVKFEAAISSESAGWYKPAPGAFSTLAQRTGVTPDCIWYVGDHLNEDVRGSQAAGMTAIWVNRPGGAAYYAGQVGVETGASLKPDAEVSDLLGVVALLDKAAF
jgi:2-haloalkanoic acid dehalogenase type II